MSPGHPDDEARAPLYARVLRLRHLAPSGFLCFIFVEGAVALGVLLALAELVNWWGVLLLPLTVAAMVKLNDVVAGALTAAAPAGRDHSRGASGGAAGRYHANGAASADRDHSPGARMTASAQASATPVGLGDDATTRLPRVFSSGAGTIKRPWAERIEAQQQRVRQSATRRYE